MSDRGIPIDPYRFKQLKESEGTWTARSICLREGAMRLVEEAETIEDLKPVLRLILDNTRFE